MHVVRLDDQRQLDLLGRARTHGHHAATDVLRVGQPEGEVAALTIATGVRRRLVRDAVAPGRAGRRPVAQHDVVGIGPGRRGKRTDRFAIATAKGEDVASEQCPVERLGENRRLGRGVPGDDLAALPPFRHVVLHDDEVAERRDEAFHFRDERHQAPPVAVAGGDVHPFLPCLLPRGDAKELDRGRLGAGPAGQRRAHRALGPDIGVPVRHVDGVRGFLGGHQVLELERVLDDVALAEHGGRDARRRISRDMHDAALQVRQRAAGAPGLRERFHHGALTVEGAIERVAARRPNGVEIVKPLQVNARIGQLRAVRGAHDVGQRPGDRARRDLACAPAEQRMPDRQFARDDHVDLARRLRREVIGGAHPHGDERHIAIGLRARQVGAQPGPVEFVPVTAAGLLGIGPRQAHLVARLRHLVLVAQALRCRRRGAVGMRTERKP